MSKLLFLHDLRIFLVVILSMVGAMSPVKWWVVHGTSVPMLKSLALKLLGQPCSFSC